MEDSFKTYPQDGEWMSAYKWKERMVKQLKKKCVVNRGVPILETTITIKELLGK